MFRILHLSDLHIRENTTWSTDAILRDAKRIILEQARAENFNVVAFTGDIAFSGKANEYELAAKWLEDLCFHTSGLNMDPKEVVFVPGNHDVDRSLISPAAHAIAEQLARATAESVVATYYDNAESRQLLMNRHSAYFEFVQKFTQGSDLASPQWSRVFEYSGFRIRIDGINSSWLCRDENDHRHLIVGQSQLTELIRNHDDADLCIALMHHPLADLMEFDEKNTTAFLRQNTDILLRGHLHDPDIRQIHSNTGDYLEFAAGALYEGHDRPNCFSVIDIDDDLITVYVRTFIWDRGRWIMDRNLYQTDDGVGVFYLPPRTANIKAVETTGIKSATSNLSEGEEASADRESALDAIRNFPKFQAIATKQDISIRHNELSKGLSICRESRLVSITKEPGSKPSGFVACLIKELQNTLGDCPQLSLACSGVSTGEQLQDVLGLVSLHTVTSFAAKLRDCGPCILVLEDLDDLQQMQPNDGPSIDDTIQALVDFCRDLYVIRLSSLPFRPEISSVRIGSLSLPDTRAYLNASGASGFLQSNADYSRVHRVTGGLPVHLDDLMHALSVTNLEGALAQVDSQPVISSSQLPEHIVREVDTLRISTDDELSRSNRLLCILSVLERGESLTTIRRLDQRAPIWPRHANYLQARGLLDIIDSNPRYYAETKMPYPSDGDKILRVARLVRDYVLSEMDQQEKSELIKQAAQLYFSDDWRIGQVRMRRRVAFGSEISTHQSGNEMTVLRYLASEPTAYFSGSEKTSAFSLGLSYISQLKSKGFYGEAYEAARDFLGFASDVSYEVDAEAICLLQTLAGSCARMIGEKEASIVFINDALPTLRQLGQKAKLADALVVLAMALQGLSRNEEAIKVAEEIIDIVPRESSDYFQAKAILAELDSDKDAKIRKLKPLRSRARNLGFHTVADNITLELVNESDDTEEKLRLLGDIKSRGDREYNYVRATIRRVETLLASGREQEITTIDQRDLWRSYNLAYSQRLVGIFDWCHRVCWQFVEKNRSRQDLIELFMFSSFVWRINGDSKSEILYARLLRGTVPQSVGVSVLHYLDSRIRSLGG
ncbi:MAG: metallophosphoesterase [Planctomycetales bacterium]|nr:metallophosphoesterase [Planctomycetales bacterium]